MGKYILRRILYAIPIAFGVSVVCFSLVYLAPGDPLQTVRAAGRDRRDDRDHQARLWLRQAAADAVPDLARPGADRRFRHVDRRPSGRCSTRSRWRCRTPRMLAVFAVPLAFSIGFAMGALAGSFPGTLDRPGRDRRRGVRRQPAELLARHRAGHRLRRRTLAAAGDRHGVAGIRASSTRCTGATHGF